MMNEEHWREFYSKPHLELAVPSSFAIWAGQFLHNRRIVDLGCGTGRDTRYFRQQNPLAYGVDVFAPQAAGFLPMTLEDYLRADPEVEVVYCRFLFHAIEARLQKKILDWAFRWGATIYIEARSNLDKPGNDHKRRLIDGQGLVSEMIGSGWRVLHYEEGFGRAKFGAEDPHVLRIVAKGKQ
jgi:hypothetical protein